MPSDAGSGTGNPQDQDAGREEATGERGRTIAEWTTLAISVALILGLVGLVTYVSLSGGSEPPIIEARPLEREVRHEGASYYLPVEIANRGGRTAEEVLIQADLMNGAGVPETAELTIDFLAGGERVEGTVVFTSDPLGGELTIGVASFR